MTFSVPLGFIVIGVVGALFIIYRHIKKIQDYNKQLFIRAWQLEVMLMHVSNDCEPATQEQIKKFLDAIEPLD